MASPPAGFAEAPRGLLQLALCLRHEAGVEVRAGEVGIEVKDLAGDIAREFRRTLRVPPPGFATGRGGRLGLAGLASELS